MRRAALALAPLLLALGACTGGSTGHAGDARSSAKPSAGPSTDYLWERTDLRAATRPILVGGRVLMYTQDGTFLSVTALDAATGKTVWSVRASDSLITGGVAFGLTVVGKNVVFLEPAEKRGRPLARAAANDAATGRRVWDSDSTALYGDMPSDCDDDNTVLCASGGIDFEGSGVLRLSKKDGSLRVAPSQRALRRGIGNELYDTGERRPDYIARILDNGRQVWKRPLAAMFGADVSSNTGWNWHLYGAVNVGSMGLRRDPAPKTQDLAGWVLVGIDQASGRTLWRAPGKHLRCLGALDDVAPKAEDVAYRCAYTGTIPIQPDRKIDASHVSSIIEGFDPKTGKTTWRVDVGVSPALAAGSPGPMGLGGTLVALPRPGRPPLKLDLRSGAHEDLAPTTPGWCAEQNPYPLSSSAAFEAVRQGENLLVPCRADGEPLATPAPNTTDFGIRAGGALIWAGPDGVHAVRDADG